MQWYFVMEASETSKSGRQSAISSCILANPTNTTDYCELLHPAPENFQLGVALVLGISMALIMFLPSHMEKYPDLYPALFTEAPGILQPSQKPQRKAEKTTEERALLEVISDEPRPNAPPAELQS